MSGPDLVGLFVAPLERLGLTYVIHRDTALRADVYLAGGDPFHAWALANRLTIRVA